MSQMCYIIREIPLGLRTKLESIEKKAISIFDRFMLIRDLDSLKRALI